MVLQKRKILRTPAVFSSNFPFSEDLSNHCFFQILWKNSDRVPTFGYLQEPIIIGICYVGAEF